jgi:hypothetical protein
MEEQSMAELTTEAPATAQKNEPTQDEIMEELRQALRVEAAKQGLTPELLQQLKGQHGEVAVVPIGEKIFAIRALTRKEWKELRKKQVAAAQSQGAQTTTADLDFEEEITMKAVIFPEMDLMYVKQGIPAGIPSSIAEAVTNHCGFVQNATPIVI